jgi:hypothetical protein
MPNYFRTGVEWLDIATLPPKGPILLADETQTIQWFVEKPTKAAVGHQEHERDEHGAFIFDGEAPRMKASKVKPAFWAPVRVVD